MLAILILYSVEGVYVCVVVVDSGIWLRVYRLPSVFIARQYTEYRHAILMSVRLSVRPSVQCWYCVEKDIVLLNFIHSLLRTTF